MGHPHITHVNKIFHYKPSILGYPWEPPFMGTLQKRHGNYLCIFFVIKQKRRVFQRFGHFHGCGSLGSRKQTLPLLVGGFPFMVRLNKAESGPYSTPHLGIESLASPKIWNKWGFPKMGVPQQWTVYKGKSIYKWMIWRYPTLLLWIIQPSPTCQKANPTRTSRSDRSGAKRCTGHPSTFKIAPGYFFCREIPIRHGNHNIF